MKILLKFLFVCVAVTTGLGAALNANAAVPDGLNYQAYLTNTDGTAVDTDISITFAAYNVDLGGVPLWSDTQSVSVSQGLFSITLGNPANPFPAGLFDDPVYIGLFVAGEELLPRRMLATSAYSFKAADADLLNGVPASSLDQSTDVANLQSDVSINDSRISDLELIGADITGVSIGAGLTGGGSMGDVTLSVAPGGIDGTHIAPNSVGSGAIIDGAVGSGDIAVAAVNSTHLAANSVGTGQIADGNVTTIDIANGAVNPSKIDATGSYTFGGITNNGPTLLNNSLTIESSADIRIHDGFNGFRWYDSPGTTQFAGFEINNTSVRFRDYNQNRDILYSDGDSVGVGTAITTAFYGVTVPSLSVLGAASVGLERVIASYPLSSMSGSCHSHGNLPCYYGSGSVQCPVGKRVLGGGSSGSSALFGSLSLAYPATTTSFSCGSSYDLSGVSRSCYAVCARLE